MVAPVVRLGALRTPIAHSPLQRAKEHRIQDGVEPGGRCIGQQFLRPLKRACSAQPPRYPQSHDWGYRISPALRACGGVRGSPPRSPTARTGGTVNQIICP